MEKTLSNELFIVGVSLDCLCAAVPQDSKIYDRLSALSGQVLSDSRKIAEIEEYGTKLAARLDEIRDFAKVLRDEFSGCGSLDGMFDLIEKDI